MEVRFRPLDELWQELTPYQNAYLDEVLFHPLQEFMARPQKSVRSRLVEIGYMMVSGFPEPKEADLLKSLAQVFEGIHSASLIVDDIQDSSPLRRNKPSLHVQHGIPKALNAGNWLYFWALRNIERFDIKASTKRNLQALLQHMLFEGHLGQAFDLGKPITDVPGEEMGSLIEVSMIFKTGSLTGTALASGAVLAGMSYQAAQKVKCLGVELGLILQIYDDLKNLKLRTGEENKSAGEIQGKRLEDLRLLRPNFIWAFAAALEDELALPRLREAAQQYPRLTLLQEWMVRYDYHGRCLIDLENRERHLLQRLYPYIEMSSFVNEVCERFEDIINQLKEAYEKS